MGISTHILDTSLGRPAANVPVSLARAGENKRWVPLNQMVTDADGRCRSLLPEDEALTPGVYIVHFDTASYYEAQEVPGLYPYVQIVFTVEAGQAHYHIPLLLTANGYTTYRGT
ncbi:hydroxyisourate hydrolase [Granulicella sibirica]|uniref:5-hydroxyisourate hydrolase n=1 Tax=Granulicella sibirica TaxID=2479048 RepID=A0A4Q0SYE8_9BACT|nr:hydroxyisourate hydrolase [Granulicella sibirica]RXH55010.1 5-Hydroxyisourate Hydrolase (HIUase) [Granulicella sibirica]